MCPVIDGIRAGFHRWARFRTAILVAFLLAAGTLLACLTVERADRSLRREFLRQARVVAQSVNVERIQTLSGTEADLDAPDYLRLKEQLAAAKEADSRCRFLYLMGRKPDGTMFFFVDNEPVGTAEESPAGQIYEEISPGCVRAFETRSELTEGPITDRWGTWISALIPITDPDTGELIAVLGMDIAADGWNRNVAARSALPAGLTLALLILVGFGLVTARSRSSSSTRPVQHRLLIPLAAVLLLLIGGFGATMLFMHQEQLKQSTREILAAATFDLNAFQENQIRTLATLEEILLRSPDLRDALAAQDRDRLLAASEPAFAQLLEQHHITHFYFHGPDRVNLLRVHKPEKFGDLIDRFTAREAERTGQTASGTELGPLGTFTVRVVRPVFDGDALIGYLELGMEIEDILADIHEEHGVELAVSIRKNVLDRGQWAAGMKMLGREADWNRFPEAVLIYNSLPCFPSQCDRFLQDEAAHRHGDVTAEAEFNDKSWRIILHPLVDVSGVEVGDLIVLHDISEAKTSFYRLLILVLTAAAVLLAALLGFLYFVLRRVDRSIREQHQELSSSEERLDLAMSVANDGIWDWNLGSDTVLLDRRYYTMAGYEPDEFPGVLGEWEKRVHPDDYQQAVSAFEHYLAGEGEIYEAEFRFLRKDGDYMWVRARGEVVARDSDGNPVRFVGTHSDITERKKVEDSLRKSEHLHRTLVEALPDFIVVLDAGGTIRRVNRLQHGYREEDVVGRKAETFLQADFRDAYNEAFRKAVATGRLQAVETEVDLLDGRHHFINRLSPVTLAGDESAVMLISTDITDRKQEEELIRKNLEEVERINRLMSKREERVVEMKREVNALLEELGREIRYESVFTVKQGAR